MGQSSQTSFAYDEAKNEKPKYGQRSREMKVVMEKWGMRMHWGKTKVMMVSRTGEECKIGVEGEEVEEVEKLKYLGVTISRDEKRFRL